MKRPGWYLWKTCVGFSSDFRMEKDISDFPIINLFPFLQSWDLFIDRTPFKSEQGDTIIIDHWPIEILSVSKTQLFSSWGIKIWNKREISKRFSLLSWLFF